MKKTLFAITLMAIFVSGGAFAVEPTYTGPLGNPEEPALRPYKWIYHGVKSFVYQTASSFQHGNMKTPIIGTVEVGRGARRGTVELLEATYRGAICSPIPEKLSAAEMGEANRAIEDDDFLHNITDFSFTWAAYPILKVCVDNHPLQTEEEVQRELDDAKKIRQEREAQRKEREAAAKAQREAEKKERKESVFSASRPSRENLLKLAK